MIELTGNEYLEYIQALDEENLLYEFIKQVVVGNAHFTECNNAGVPCDEDIVFRYNVIVREVYGRMVK